MKLSKYVLFILFILNMLPFHELRAQAEKPTVAVLNLQGIDVPANEALMLSERLRTELAHTNAFVLVERNRMDRILEEQGFQLSGCTSQACAIEAGKLLNVQEICMGSVGKIGRLYTVSVRLIDVQSGRLVKTVSEDCSCPIEDVLTQAMRRVALKLAGLISVRSSVLSGSVFVQSLPAKAEIFIDGKKYGQTPDTINGLHAGKHKIILRKKGFVPFKASLEIVPQKTGSFSATLESLASLLIETEPSGARITLNGRFYGRSPLRLQVPPDSSLSLQITSNHYQPVAQTITLKSGDFKELHYTLAPKTATLIFSGLPAHVRVFTNGQEQPISAGKLILPFGTYHILLKAANFKDKTLTIRLKPDETKSLRITMAPKSIAGAAWRSAFFPGWGQHYQDKSLRGLLFALGTFAGVSSSYYYYRQYRSSLERYDEVRERYRLAFSLENIEVARQNIHAEYRRSNTLRQKTLMAMGVTAAIYLWNILDTVLLPPSSKHKFKLQGKTGNGQFGIVLNVQW